MDGWMDGWVDGWMNGQVDEQRGRHHAPRLARYKPDQMPSVSVRDREHAYLAMTSLGSRHLATIYLVTIWLLSRLQLGEPQQRLDFRGGHPQPGVAAERLLTQ